MPAFQGDGGKRDPPSRRLWTALCEINRYLSSQSAWLVNYAERHRAGLRVGAALTEGTANFLVNRRMNKSQQMRWSHRGADLLLQVCYASFNGKLGSSFGQLFQAVDPTSESAKAASPPIARQSPRRVGSAVRHQAVEEGGLEPGQGDAGLGVGHDPVADGRDHAHLPALLKKLDERDDLVIIVDGAAGRVAIDEALNKLADLILVPFTGAYHDAVRAVRHLERLPGAVAAPNRWPTHPAAKAHANKLLGMLPTDRLLGPVPAIGKIADLLNPTEYGRAATILSRPGRSFALEVLHRMNAHPLDLRKRS
jgi:hypothetical protein